MLTLANRALEKFQASIDDLDPRCALPLIPSPVRKVDFQRDANVADLLRKAITLANANMPDGSQKYVQFPEYASERKLNTDAKDVLEILMIECIGKNYGDYVWGTVCRGEFFAQ